MQHDNSSFECLIHQLKNKPNRSMDNKDKLQELRQINEYYHDWCSKMLNVIYYLEDGLEMKHNIKLPQYLLDQVNHISDNFKFKYEEKL